MTSNRDPGRLVYSSGPDGDRRGAAPAPKASPSRPSSARAQAAKAPPALPNDGVVRIFREKAHRGGKVVTVIRGLPEQQLEARATELKRLCGAGGTLRDGAVEIQGDHRERVAAVLRDLGYTVKLAGG